MISKVIVTNLLTIGIMLAGDLSIAAPFPGTSSSALIAESLGIYRSDKGFLVGSGSSDWQPQFQQSDGIFSTIRFAPSDNSEASLIIRVDELKHPQSLGEYTKSWVKDYGHYGFDVLRIKRIRVQGELGVLVDLSHSGHEKMLRQVVFLRDQKAVVMTCQNKSSEFAISLRSCNQIINSFTWAKTEGEPTAIIPYTADSDTEELDTELTE